MEWSFTQKRYTDIRRQWNYFIARLYTFSTKSSYSKALKWALHSRSSDNMNVCKDHDDDDASIVFMHLLAVFPQAQLCETSLVLRSEIVPDNCCFVKYQLTASSFICSQKIRRCDLSTAVQWKCRHLHFYMLLILSCSTLFLFILLLLFE